MTETWLSQAAYDRLQGELKTLKTTGRNDIAKRIEQARGEGDLRENGGYHAAKDEQGRLEARIRRIQELLRTAKVSQAPAARGIVEPGTIITAQIDGRKIRFLLGNREISPSSSLAIYSESSAIGQALMGLKTGDEAKYESPTGLEIRVKILEIETYEGQ